MSYIFAGSRMPNLFFVLLRFMAPVTELQQQHAESWLTVRKLSIFLCKPARAYSNGRLFPVRSLCCAPTTLLEHLQYTGSLLGGLFFVNCTLI